MAIRPRLGGAWHNYSRVFEDLRLGRLTYEEYGTMVEEDDVEMGRRINDSLLKEDDGPMPDKIKGLCAPSPFLERGD